MKIIEEKKRTKVVLENRDVLEITTTEKKYKIIVKCLGKTLSIEEENNQDLVFEDEEKQAIKVMEKYLEEHEND